MNNTTRSSKRAGISLLAVLPLALFVGGPIVAPTRVAAQTVPQRRVISFTCLNCGWALPPDTKVGDRCPHCGAIIARIDEHIQTETIETPSRTDNSTVPASSEPSPLFGHKYVGIGISYGAWMGRFFHNTYQGRQANPVVRIDFDLYHPPHQELLLSTHMLVATSTDDRFVVVAPEYRIRFGGNDAFHIGVGGGYTWQVNGGNGVTGTTSLGARFGSLTLDVAGLFGKGTAVGTLSLGIRF